MPRATGYSPFRPTGKLTRCDPAPFFPALFLLSYRGSSLRRIAVITTVLPPERPFSVSQGLVGYHDHLGLWEPGHGLAQDLAQETKWHEGTIALDGGGHVQGDDLAVHKQIRALWASSVLAASCSRRSHHWRGMKNRARRVLF